MRDGMHIISSSDIPQILKNKLNSQISFAYLFPPYDSFPFDMYTSFLASTPEMINYSHASFIYKKTTLYEHSHRAYLNCSDSLYLHAILIYN